MAFLQFFFQIIFVGLFSQVIVVYIFFFITQKIFNWEIIITLKRLQKYAYYLLTILFILIYVLFYVRCVYTDHKMRSDLKRSPRPIIYTKSKGMKYLWTTTQKSKKTKLDLILQFDTYTNTLAIFFSFGLVCEQPILCRHI